MPAARPPTNYRLLFPYTLPFFAYVLLLGRGREFLGDPGGYALAAAAAVAALQWGRRWLLPLRGAGSVAGSTLVGVVAGVVGTGLWVTLKAPFVEDLIGESPSPAAFWWRLGVSASVVPFVEEWLFRGLVFRAASQWVLARREGLSDPLGVALHERSIGELPPSVWTGFALVFSSIVFAAGHAPGEWIAATAYGVLMATLVIWRGDLLSAVVAHAMTNATLALYVQRTAQWGLW